MQISAEIVAFVPPGGTQCGYSRVNSHDVSPTEWKNPSVLGASGKSCPKQVPKDVRMRKAWHRGAPRPASLSWVSDLEIRSRLGVIAEGDGINLSRREVKQWIHKSLRSTDVCAFRVGKVEEPCRYSPCAQQGGTDGKSIRAQRRKSSGQLHGERIWTRFIFNHSAGSY